MRILLIVDCYLPSTKSSAKLVHDLAVEFHHHGHEVIVTTPDDTLAEPCRVTFINGVKVLRIRAGQIKGANKIIRAVNELRLSSVIWKTGRYFFRNNQCDIIVFYSPSIFFGRLVQKLKKLWNCKAYLILRDIFPQWAVDAGILKDAGLICRFFRAKERQQYAAADVIGVQSPANLEYFEEYEFKQEPQLEVLYNWTKINQRNAAGINERQRLGLQDKIVFFFGGNIGVAQDMDNIIRLAKSLRPHTDIHFLLIGDGSEVLRLKNLIWRDGLNNVSILPSMPQDQYHNMLSQFDIGLISLAANLKTHNFPGKMLGYMNSAMPILASVNQGNDLKHMLEEANAGLVCINGDDSEFYNNAIRLAKDGAFRAETGYNARVLLDKKFSVASTALQILSHVKKT